jgi:glycosyltransferase involved in cell wall biosynthesis
LDSLRVQDYGKENFEVILVSPKPIVNFGTGLFVKTVQVGSETGYADARNKGVAEAKGEIFAFIDDDCIAPTQWLSAAVRIFLKDQTVVAVGGPSIPFVKDTLRRRVGGYMFQSPFLVGFVSSRYHALPQEFETRGEHLILANTLVQRAAFESIGGFDLDQIPCEDGYFYFRLREQGYKLWYAPQAFVWHRAKPVFMGLVKRVFVYGLGRGGVTARSFKSLRFAYLIPTAFVLSVCVLAVLSLFSKVFLVFLFLELAFYLLFDFLHTIFLLFKFEKNIQVAFLVFLATPIMHIAYGLGVLYGIYAHIAKKGKGDMELLRKFDV